MKLVNRFVIELYRKHFGEVPDAVDALPPSGSSRQYFRLSSEGNSVIAAYNPDVRENRAFLYMTRHFGDLGLPVPQVMAADESQEAYLLNDLGDTTLFSLLPHNQVVANFSDDLVSLYQKTLTWLTHFQVRAAKGFDYSICYPRQAFDRHSMMWDLNYFKYYFLKISGVSFDEQLLEDSFDAFVNHLLQGLGPWYMYRDFQSRNIMVVDGEPFFIDYQGGRRGPLQYDVASLLFDAKANVPFSLRQSLLDFYIGKIADISPGAAPAFQSHYYDFVLIRVMQALATYGFRGGVEKKPLFLQSMPYALNNIKWLADNELIPKQNPYLRTIMEKVALKAPKEFPPAVPDGLTVKIRSFSYRKGIPADDSGNGGGFVFDCRILPNPGRLDAYKPLSGKDEAVARYLSNEDAFETFMQSATQICDNAVENYISRGFHHLMICFGCTGGQHRSVYCAETLAAHLAAKYAVTIDIQHIEEHNWPS